MTARKSTTQGGDPPRNDVVNVFPAHLAKTFLLEAEDLLDQIEDIVLDVEKNPRDAEAINRLFRAFHTIKGSGAMFGFEAVTRFTHHVETALDQVRTGAVAFSSELVELILAARDQIKVLLESPEPATTVDDLRSTEIVAALSLLLGTATPTDSASSSAPSPSAFAGPPADPAAPRQNWRIRFRPPLDIAANGQDPLSLLSALRQLGPCTVTALTDAIPPLLSLNPEQCHLSWDIALSTDQGLNAIKDVFIFVEDESELKITEETAAAPAGELPVAVSTTAPRAEPAHRHPIAETARAGGSTARHRAAKDSIVRVPAERLDRLVNLVGELVMNQSRLSQVSARSDDSNLAVPVEELERLIAELRDTILGIRMMPIGTTFSRFKRLVHDLSAELHKEVDLVTEGAETELDKTVLDQLGDPLVHLIRNSIDHGIEAPDERARIGKPRCGTIKLAAAHVGSNVVITIEDDGSGLDVAAIRAKAIDKKLIAAGANLSPHEITNLILLPGFSTAKKVTNVSGRGVGMDVVKKEIDALRGSIQIASEPGRGTTISATLPLTLAIIDGLLVEIDRDQFIIPMSAVYENVELARSERSRNNGRNVIAVRGELVPYVCLRELFGCTSGEPELEKVVIVRHGGDRVGLVVDRVIGNHQTVIQSLGRFYRGIEVLSGATIMGDGRVALIIDVGGLVRVVEKQNVHRA